MLDRFALRVEDAFLRRHEHARSPRHGVSAPGSRADAARDLLVCLLDAAEVASETILVELLSRAAVPEPAGIGADLVAENDRAVMAAELELHVDEDDAALGDERPQDCVYLQRELDHAIDLRLRRHPEDAHVPLVDHRIVEGVALVVELDDRLGQRLALFHPEAFREAAGDDVPHHHLDRHDLETLHQHVAVVEAADEMRRHPLALEETEEDLRDGVVANAFLDDRAAFLGVERGRVVLEVLEEKIGIAGGEELLRLPLVDELSRFHVAHRIPPGVARTGRGRSAGPRRRVERLLPNARRKSKSKFARWRAGSSSAAICCFVSRVRTSGSALSASAKLAPPSHAACAARCTQRYASSRRAPARTSASSTSSDRTMPWLRSRFSRI